VSFDIEDFGVDFKILEGRNMIGSKSSNEITVQDTQVSSVHALILCRKDTFLLSDEMSSNGTTVNDLELSPRNPAELNDGDEIKIGNTTLLFKKAFK
jgi:pSer/pThr/pTyr-binding forkhead associated (FHA) protein